MVGRPFALNLSDVLAVDPEQFMTRTDSQPLFGAVEAGGTKFVCAIGDARANLLERTRIDTRDPDSTFAAVLEFFRDCVPRSGALQAVGVASFGPLDLDRASPRFGHLLHTPKAGWSDIDVRGLMARELGVPVGIDTDVNAAALGEARWGGGRGLGALAYVTVGTGIGVGLVHDGRTWCGMTHPEMGHIVVRRHALDQHFAGVCAFHRDCLEGLASGPAILARFGRPLNELPADHPAWEIQADYLGQLCMCLVVSVAPHRILIGGGVMQQVRLYPALRSRMRHWLNGYCQNGRVTLEEYVSPPELAADSGIMGALALAMDAAGDAAGA